MTDKIEDQAREIYRQMDAYQLDAIGIAFPDDIEADIEIAIMNHEVDSLYDWLIASNKLTPSDVLMESAEKYARLVKAILPKDCPQCREAVPEPVSDCGTEPTVVLADPELPRVRS